MSYYKAGLGADKPKKKDKGLGELFAPLVLMIGIPTALYLSDKSKGK